MIYRIAVLAGLCVASLTSTVQAEWVLDAFNSDQVYSVEARPSNHTNSGFGGVSDALGDRDLNVLMTLPIPHANWAKVTVGDPAGELTFASSYLLASRSVSGYAVSYGHDSPLGIDLSSYHAFQLTLLHESVPQPSITHWQMTIDGVSADATVNNQILEWQQSQFAGVDFSNVGEVAIFYHLTPTEEIGPLASGNVRMGELRAVPEPSSFALMGLAGIGLGIGIWRRRRRA